MKINIIGTGNVATVLAKQMVHHGHQIIEVWGRDTDAAKVLANILNAQYQPNINNLSAVADIILIAVSDSAVADVAKQLAPTSSILLHTAAALSKEILLTASNNVGVLYPLQSIRKEMNYIPSIPFFVEGNSEAVTQIIWDFAHTLSAIVNFGNQQQRLQLHIAAVMVSNFTNHLYALAHQFCDKEQLQFTTLLPLIEETANRLKYGVPAAQLQTGPAVRNDLNTIYKHKSLLEKYPTMAQLYQSLSDSIWQLHQKETKV